MSLDNSEIKRAVRERRAELEPLYREIAKVLVSQRPLVDRLLIGLLAGGHILLEGVPGWPRPWNTWPLCVPADTSGDFPSQGPL
jgi:hypothetical protein